MNRNLTWRTILILIVAAWAAYTLYPLRAVNLITYFDKHAHNKDEAYHKFFAKVIERTNSVPSAYLNLRETAREEKIALTNYFSGRKFYRPDIKDSNQAILIVLQREAHGKIKLGLDLIGGNSFLIEMDMKDVQEGLRSQALSEATKILRKRLDKYGVAEPVLQAVGENRILVQMPGLDDASTTDVRSTLQRTAHLEFRLVHKDNDDLVTRMDQPGFRPPPGYDKLELKERHDTNKRDVVFVSQKTVLTGQAVKAAYVAFEAMGNQPYVSMEFNNEGAKAFGDITSAHIHERLAILLDGEIYSAPVIQSAILGGQAQITGRFSLQEAAELANVLENPLAAPVKIVEERRVGASLGQDSIQSGIKSSIIGAIAVAVFILFYYYFVGLIADFALLLNVLIMLAVLVTFEATLTLPGIAGIALTIGMAVDANVLIYERVREELLAGKRVAAAIVAGYAKAFSTIIDSNLTTLITSVILIFFGTGPVQGFGVTLTIGICVSMFTALVVTRVIFDFLLGKGKLQTIRMQRWIKETKIDFMGLRVWAFGISWTMIAVGIVWCVMRWQNNTLLGVDFAGGDSVMLKFQKSVEIAQVRNSLEAAGLKEVFIQYQSDASGAQQYLNVKTEFDEGKEVEPLLAKAFPEAGFALVGLDKVQPIIGKEILWSATLAVFWSLVGILFYVAVRFEFPFAVGAVLAIVHDVLMTVAWFALTGRQVSATFIAAILTIIGYSINDTIVVFDRVREDLRLGKHGTLVEIMNRAINETLSRTTLTGGTVFIATLALYLFGGGAINDFAFCFLVGIVTGTYSSIFIASPIVLWWNKGKKVEVGVKPKPTIEGEATV